MVEDTVCFTVGAQIKSYRNAAHLSQKELAAQLGVTPTRLCNWENNRHEPNISMLVKLCEALEVSPDDFLQTQKLRPEYSVKERMLINQYREKHDLQKAINLLAGI
jgi:transcriptional regulator with XRE-family HTH domain